MVTLGHIIEFIALQELVDWHWYHGNRGVRYAESLSIRYFIANDIFKNVLIDIDIFKTGQIYIDNDIFQIVIIDIDIL